MRNVLACFALLVSLGAAAEPMASCTIFENTGDGFSWETFVNSRLRVAPGLGITAKLRALDGESFVLEVKGWRSRDTLTFKSGVNGTLPNNEVQYSCEVRVLE